MIVYTTYIQTTEGKTYIEGSCASGDTKPTDNIAHGSILLELASDGTLTPYGFVESSGDWVAIS